jgi:N-acetylglutamate synthase-like GNAT family acetyltransferase
MTIRDFKESDIPAIEEILRMYWTDKEFIKKVLLKLQIALDKTPEYLEKKYKIFVAEINDEVVGVAGLRKASDYMKQFTKTDNPGEFYILAVKYKKQGIGEALRLKRLEEAKELGFTEIVLYSPNSHKESWSFHDRLGFVRFGEALAPDGEPGMIWTKEL